MVKELEAIVVSAVVRQDPPKGPPRRSGRELLRWLRRSAVEHKAEAGEHSAQVPKAAITPKRSRDNLTMAVASGQELLHKAGIMVVAWCNRLLIRSRNQLCMELVWPQVASVPECLSDRNINNNSKPQAKVALV